MGSTTHGLWLCCRCAVGQRSRATVQASGLRARRRGGALQRAKRRLETLPIAREVGEQVGDGGAVLYEGTVWLRDRWDRVIYQGTGAVNCGA